MEYHWVSNGLKRVTPAAIKIKDLPSINAFVISHDHFDHLNFASLTYLNRRFPKMSGFVPLRTEKDFGRNFKSIIGMDWYTKAILNDVTIHFVPAQHWGRRGLFDKNHRLWGGWIFEYNNEKIYFAGDTAYSQVFKDIRKKYGAMDTCLLPIVAFKPHSFKKHHITPERALTIADEMGCTTMIPWGYGTFQLGY